jgi:hypothetical protein
MDEIQPSDQTEHAEPADTHTVRRIAVTVGIVVAVLILVAVAIYAVAFVILAPMMH